MSFYRRIKNIQKEIAKKDNELFEKAINNKTSFWPTSRPTLEERNIMDEIYKSWLNEQNITNLTLDICYDIWKRIENYMMWNIGNIDDII